MLTDSGCQEKSVFGRMLTLQAIFIEHYQDKFARDDAGWYFTHRLITRVLVGNLSFHRAEMS